jgi:hypothetical protein
MLVSDEAVQQAMDYDSQKRLPHASGLAWRLLCVTRSRAGKVLLQASHARGDALARRIVGGGSLPGCQKTCIVLSGIESGSGQP